MIILDSTSDVLKLVTSAAGSIDVNMSVVDVTGMPQVATAVGVPNFNIATATTTSIGPSPAASTQRNVKECSIYNAHATVVNTVTVQHTDGATLVSKVKCTLYPGDTLAYVDGSGWQYLPASTSLVVPGRLLLTTVTTTGTTFTTGALTNSARVFGVGGGGGGSGCTSVAADAAAGGGGGAGGFFEKLFVVAPLTAYTYAIGAAGAGNSGAGGGNGGDTTFAVGGTTCTAKGGTGAVVATATAALTAYAGGAGGVVGTNGDINAPGMSGNYGVTLVVAGPVVASGSGGSGPFGAGGVGITAVGAGNAGLGNGSGGGGSATGASAARTGGVGTVGLIQVDEYS